MKYVQFHFATGKKNIVPFPKGTKKEIMAYIKRFKNVNGGVCKYEIIKREDAFMFDNYNRIYDRQ